MSSDPDVTKRRPAHRVVSIWAPPNEPEQLHALVVGCRCGLTTTVRRDRRTQQHVADTWNATGHVPAAEPDHVPWAVAVWNAWVAGDRHPLPAVQALQDAGVPSDWATTYLATQ